MKRLNKQSVHIEFVLIMLSAGCTQVTPTFPATMTHAVEIITPASATDIAIPPAATPSPSPIGTASPYPTINFPITPDATQLEHWREYHTALAKKLLSFLPAEKVLCEWEVLGQSSQEVYVWAVCQGPLPGSITDFSSASVPAVIYLEENGTVQSIKIPGSGSLYSPDIRKMFPPDVQQMIFGRTINYHSLSEHLKWRLEHPEEPPLIVLSATPIP